MARDKVYIFDISNMIKYGVPSAQWIRMLGKRLVKFDFKGYSKDKQWVAIGEGDEDWPEVLKALGEIGYDGWATSEVGGGGEKELADITARMKKRNVGRKLFSLTQRRCIVARRAKSSSRSSTSRSLSPASPSAK